MSQDSVVSIKSLKKYFPIKRGLLSRTVGWVKACDGVSLEIKRGQTMGLVGESGCGKTTLGRSILRLLEPDSGEIFFEGQEITRLPQAQMRGLRQKMQIVFQDPFSSLNPRFTVSRIVSEGLLVFRTLSADQLKQRVVELLDLVGLSADVVNRYPHEFSGGQRQRIGIARAISLNPAFLVLDEPISSLDVSIQAQILNLLSRLQKKLKLSYLFITHDLNVARLISDQVAVMYLGRVVEQAPGQELFDNPLHPYTQLLLQAIPVADPTKRKKRVKIRTDVDQTQAVRSGCCFRDRCLRAINRCEFDQPTLKKISPGHFVSCHLSK